MFVIKQKILIKRDRTTQNWRVTIKKYARVRKAF